MADTGLYSGGIMDAFGSWTCSLSLSLVLSLGLDLWLAEPETLSSVHTSMFPDLGLGNMGKVMELWLMPFGILGLTS